MIRRLRIKFIAIIMTMLTVLLLVIFCSLNYMMVKSGRSQSYERMERVAESDGGAAREASVSPFGYRGEIRIFTPMPRDDGIYYVKLTRDGLISEMFVPYEDFISKDGVTKLVSEVLKAGKERGKLGNQLYIVREKDYGSIIVFSDEQAEDIIMQRLIRVSLIIGAASLVVMFFVSILLSRWAIKPVETTLEDQRRFISDASHELKTPLTVINTNADVLKSEIGENKWLGYIQSEAERMSKLVGDLLYLSRMDHSGGMYERKRFLLSGAVLGAVLPFESVAFEAHKNLDTDIEENIFYNGDESKLKQLVVILLDNAIKNTFDGGTITVTLSGGENKPKISVRNEGEGIDEEDIPHIFERFYRCDDSRARGTGGFGLGLAIAHDIVEQHGGKLTVVSKKWQWTEFTAAL